MDDSLARTAYLDSDIVIGVHYVECQIAVFPSASDVVVGISAVGTEIDVAVHVDAATCITLGWEGYALVTYLDV